jgi:type III pantothenate kinase
MILLLDIGNTHTHIGLANQRNIPKQTDVPTTAWRQDTFAQPITDFVGGRPIEGVAFCSVVPQVTPVVRAWIDAELGVPCFELTWQTIRGVGIDYPKPGTIGADRLANAVAVKHHFGAPAVVVDFGTAVTFDVVNRLGNYVGGIIAPGLSAMTSYLHEKTALLPAIRIREVDAVIGKNTEEAMLIGAVHGYRGLIRELLLKVKSELKARRLPVVATGGYAKLIAAQLPEITAVQPLLTLEGLRLVWEASRGDRAR